ncbi:MAG: rhodanese-like domain-containing protein, partial [Acutalibacteraceae bacterium]
SNEDREVMDMSDYADDITPFFRNVSNLARPLYQGAKAAFDNIEQMLRSAPALIQTAKAMIPEETLQAVLTNKMKRIIALLLSLLLCGGCSGTADGYKQIDQKTAKDMMDEGGVIILDVREQNEYDGGHIAGAVLLPLGTINEQTAAQVIPQKDDVVLVYCRSGNRSKKAAAALSALGYTNIYEFGGILTWPYGIES